MIQHQLYVSKIAPCEGSSYFLLHKEVRNQMKGLINIQNEYNECFRWCLARHLYLVNKTQAKMEVFIKNLPNNLILKVQNFLFRKKTKKKTFEKYVDLLLLTNCKISYYVFIKDFNRFITKKTKHRCEKHFCQYFLQCFCSSRVFPCTKLSDS